ncbi:DUF2628 domain-containing protein [Aquibium carbonis]|uniref:DUF2628 domain-containing protein n=1 Tax=Aquibium carbonis TaxID=2495581 RepID=A0A3R9YAU6_9HYPH|nr:DUF2628 domain-containing protein [Aquibium carbonis]RST88120.1 DUF2628 domain-containing protein [Aquibium carbonis]
MAIYVVMQPPRDRVDADEVYVRDGFHVLGFLLPLVWLLWNRLWIETLVLLAVMLGLGILGETSGTAEMLVGGFTLLVSIYVGLEGSALRLWALRRRGYAEWGVVDADNRADAETRYLSAQPDEIEAGPRPLPPIRQGVVPADTRGGNEPELGLFGYPGRN